MFRINLAKYFSDGRHWLRRHRRAKLRRPACDAAACLEWLEDRQLLSGDAAFDAAFRAGASGYDIGDGAVADAAGNVYVLGAFTGTVDFDPGPATVSRTGDAFVAKYGPVGNLIWVRTLVGDFGYQGGDLAFDATHNVYVTGSFQGTVDFDPGASTFSLSSPSFRSVFVLKLNSLGDFQWAKKFGGTGDADCTGIAVDANGVYTTGAFAGTVDFDPGTPIQNRISAGSRDAFLAKLTTDGNFAWASRFGSTEDDQGWSVATDSAGNVLATGHFMGTVDFDPSAGTTSLTSAGFEDVFVTKFNSSGGLLWARQLGGPPTEEARGIAVDGAGSVYTTGRFFGDGDFDPGPGTQTLVSAGGDDVFVSKLDSDGNFVWADRFGGTAADEGTGIAVDAGNTLFVTGAFQNQADFDPGAGTVNLTSAGSTDVFVVQLNSQTGAYLWAGSFAGSGEDRSADIAVDTVGGVYTTGYFRNTTDFDPGAGTFNLTSAGDADVFVSQLNYDTGIPYVTINQAVDQPDPTNETAIDFTVVFTEPVTGFVTGDVTLSSSTAPGTLVATVTPVGGDGTTYLVTVTGMTNNGNVVASIPAGVAMDGDGNVNFASTSTDNVVLFDLGNPTGAFTDPTHGGSMGAAVLNSRHYLDVTFTDPGGSGLDVTTITDPGSEFTLSGDAASGVTVNGTPQLVSGTTYRYSFTGAFGIGTVTFDFLAASFFDLAGNPNVADTGSFEAADVPTLVVTGSNVTEGNSGTINLNFTVSLSYFTDQTVTVQYATADGTATAGKDYTAKTDTLTFAPGAAPKTVSVAVIGDVLDELDETVLLMLSNATNARLPAGPGEGMILDNDADAKVSINNATVTEGNTGTTNMTFTVSLSPASGKTVQMNYATFDVTAQNGTDYQPANGVLTFAPGETSKTVTVVVNGDVLDELNETFEVRLSDVTNAAVLDGIGVGTITDDDATPTLSINDVSITEGDAGTTNAMFTVSLSALSGRVVTVQYVTANGTATAGSDYIARPLTTLTIPDGSLSATVTVPVIGDTADEPDETFLVKLSSAIGATILDSSGTGTILDNDDPPTISINDVELAEGNSGSKLANFTVSLSAASGRSVTVQYATVNGTATAGSDYTTKTGTLTFAPGVTTQTIPVSVTGDLVVEPDETFVVNLSNAVNASLADGSATGTILNDDPTLTINDVTVSEGTGATATATFTVTLSAISAQDVSVDYFTTDGSATGGSDYVSIPSGTPLTLTIPAGQKTRTLTVTVLGDTLDEANETFFVKLANAQNAIIGDDSGTGTITDTDSAPTLTINDIVVNEAAGNATFTVSLSTVSGQAVSVKYATANGTALAGSDYTAAAGTLTIPAAQPSATITVPILNDQRDEFDETFRVTLSSAVNASIADSSGTGTILDNDDPPTVSINDVAVTEGNSGSLNATFAVSLSVASGKTITLTYATAPATEGDIATAGKDYTAKTGTLTFNPGVTSLPVTVAVLGDVLDEPNETFLVKLSNPNNVTIADDTGVGTITDNDEPPAFSINNVGVIEGNPGNDVTAVFTVSLSTASGRPITVNFNTSDNGSATEGVDYLAKTDSLTFNPGDTVLMVSVTTIGDLLDEPNETFVVNLSNPMNATIQRGMGTGTITDNDPLPILAINDAPPVLEGNAGTIDAVFTVTLTGETSQEVRIHYSTANGTATAGADYTAVPLTPLVIPAGEHTATIRVPVRGDMIDEADETFFVKLATPINAQLQDNSGTGTILDDDPSPTLSIDDVEIVEGNSGSKTATFTVRLSEAASRTVTVKYATANGSATAGSDYTAKTGTLTFAAGVTSLTIPVSITGDLRVEPDETFTVNLSSAVNADLADASGTGTILNDDPTLTINDVTVTEGSGSNVIANFTVSLSAASPDFVSVDFATADGTAVEGQDYTATSGTVTFNPGETKKTIPVTVLGDFVDEPNEYFFVQLSNADNAFLGDDTGKGTITDNDSPPTLSIDDVSVTEGDSGLIEAVFTVSLSAPSTQDIRVNYSTSNGTATAGSDYDAIPLTTLEIAAGEQAATITVFVHGDTISEADETFFVKLASPVNATVADSSGTGTIRDDEPRPTLSIDDVEVTEGNSSTRNATFTVRLSEASVRTVTVQYATANDTATTAGLDYTAKTGTLSFSPGVTSLTIPVSVRGDQMIEPDETFTVNLFNPTNADLADDSGTGTILNDDSAGITIAPMSGLITTESGGTATFTVKLNTQPTSDVTLTLASDDTTEGTVSPTSLTFTSSNWNTARTVTVRGVDDSLIDGDIPYQIRVTSITTADPDYLALDPNSFVVSCTNRDNDTLGPGKVYVVVVGAGYVVDSKGQIDTRLGDNIATYAPDTFPTLTAYDGFGNLAFAAEWSDGTSGASCFLINSQYANGLLLTVYIDGF